MNQVWVFNGARSQFPSGVFSERKLAEAWIKGYKLTGVLTAYPLDTGVYTVALGKGWFKPKSEDQRSPEFIGRFSSASQEHYHYETGEPA
jgi:hypothetical protein